MAPLRGWGPKGARLRGFAPHGHWRTLTFLGALRCNQLTAPCVFDGPINGECFRAYVEQQLVPVLKQARLAATPKASLVLINLFPRGRSSAALFFRRQAMKPMPAKPRSIIAHVAGSGTSGVKRNARPCPKALISVPTICPWRLMPVAPESVQPTLLASRSVFRSIAMVPSQTTSAGAVADEDRPPLDVRMNGEARPCPAVPQ